jgi:hypothetical protein
MTRWRLIQKVGVREPRVFGKGQQRGARLFLERSGFAEPCRG